MADEEMKNEGQSMEDFTDAIDRSFRTINEGDVLEGIVTGVMDTCCLALEL